MAKTIIKETAIILLLLAVIILIFGILFYDYIPTNKTAPAKVQAYELKEEIKNELAETLDTENQNIVKTYYIDSSDLNAYESSKDYERGKQDPFAIYKTTVDENNNSNTTTNGTSNNTSSSNTTNTATPGRLLNNTGKNQ